MTVKAKFVCESVNDFPQFSQKSVSLRPVTDGSEENKSFVKYTPGGNLQLSISYETEASNFFVEGQEYFLDISKVD